MKINRFLASPLKQAVNFFENNQIDYKLVEIKPPSQYKIDHGKKETKRILKLEKKDKTYLITWSFQYNS